MNPQLTEIMVRERTTELERKAGRVAMPDGRPVAPRSPRRRDRNGLAGVLARLAPRSSRRPRSAYDLGPR